MKLFLPDVTLVLIDTIAEELADLAVRDTLELIAPDDVLIFTDNPEKFRERNSVVEIPELTSTTLYNQFLWWEVPKYISTSHMLVIQWDGWVISPEAWTDNFLNYDYIGAFWPWHRTNRVGNGGFSLRSTELMLWLAKNPHRYQPGALEDDALCRQYQQHLSVGSTVFGGLGFKWAPEELAKKFSHEHPITIFPTFPTISFGFHDVRNWTRLLNRDSLSIRLEICDKSPYISQKREYQELKQALSFFNQAEMARALSTDLQKIADEVFKDQPDPNQLDPDHPFPRR
jgi:hypothetical protein